MFEIHKLQQCSKKLHFFHVFSKVFVIFAVFLAPGAKEPALGFVKGFSNFLMKVAAFLLFFFKIRKLGHCMVGSVNGRVFNILLSSVF